MFNRISKLFGGGGDREPEGDDDWRALLVEDSISPEAFTRAYVAALKELHPEAKVTVEGHFELAVDFGERQLKSFLDNAWNDTAGQPEHRVERCERHWSALTSVLEQDPDAGVDRTAVVPVVKDVSFLKQTLEMGFDQGDPIYHDPLVADLVVVYAEDSPTQLAYLIESKVKELGLSNDQNNVSQQISNLPLW